MEKLRTRRDAPRGPPRLGVRQGRGTRGLAPSLDAAGVAGPLRVPLVGPCVCRAGPDLSL